MLYQGLALTALFVLTLLLLNTKSRIQWVIYTLVISGVFQAVYGSLMTLSGIEKIFFVDKTSYTGLVTGTFINRNHMAGYMELCLAAGLGMMIAGLATSRSGSWRERGRRLMEAMLGSKARIRISLVIMVAALVMTHSRMGNTAFFASMTIAGVIALLMGRFATRKLVILLTSLLIIDIVVVGTFFGVEKVIDRIENTTMDKQVRDEVNVYTIEMITQSPLTGNGAGTFYSSFPEFRDADVGGRFFQYAHNDYLQFAFELGLIGFAPLLLMLLLTAYTALKAQRVRKDPLMKGLSFSCIMAMIAFGIHSTVDFNLQIPANAATFMVLLALGWISLHFKEEKSLRRRRSSSRSDRDAGHLADQLI